MDISLFKKKNSKAQIRSKIWWGKKKKGTIEESDKNKRKKKNSDIKQKIQNNVNVHRP